MVELDPAQLLQLATRIQTQINELQRSADLVEKHLTTIAAQVNVQNTPAAQEPDRVGPLTETEAETLAYLRDNVIHLQNQIPKQTRRHNELATVQVRHTDQINTLDRCRAVYEENLEQLIARFDAIETDDIKDIRSRLEIHRNRLDKIEHDDAALLRVVQSNGVRIFEIEDRLDDAETAITS